MKNANQILSSKGYDHDEQNDIINYKTTYSEEGLDMKVREEFKVGDQALHLFEAYYVGDADENELNEIAIQNGHNGAEELLNAMTIRLNELCEEIPDKFEAFVKEQIRKIRLGDSITIDKYSDEFEESLDLISDEDLCNAIRNYHEVRNEQLDL